MPGAPKPALPTDAAQWVTDFDAHTFATPANAAPYKTLIESYPFIAEAMGYASLNADFRTGASGVMEVIDAATDAGGPGYVAAVSTPAAYASQPATYCDFTKAELVNTHCAKIAHALWVDINETVPWRLSSYSKDQLLGLLAADSYVAPSENLYWVFDSEGTPAATMNRCVDHSPKDVYDIVLPFISGATTKKQAASLIVQELMKSKHSTTGDDTFCATVALTESEAPIRIARNGCNHFTFLIAAWFRSINIPVRCFFSKLNPEPGHWNPAIFTEDGAVLSHGDDLFSVAFSGSGAPDITGRLPGASPDVRRCTLWNPWWTDIGSVSDQAVAGLAAAKETLRKKVEWITPNIQDIFVVTQPEISFQAKGFVYMTCPVNWYFNSGFQYPYLSYDQIDTFYQSLQRLTGGETGLLDKPTVINTGTSGTLTPASGNLIIDAAWVTSNGNTYEDMEHTGSITVTVDDISILNCKVDGNSQAFCIGVSDNVKECEIIGCELTNGFVGMQGAPHIIRNCYIHGNTSHGMKVQGTHGTALNDDQKHVFVYYNYVDVGSGEYGNLSSGYSNCAPYFCYNVFTSTSTTTPVIRIDGTDGDDFVLDRNWIEGGSNAVDQAMAGGNELRMVYNRFGRTSDTGLFTTSAGTLLWHGNVYDNDDSEAISTDTAPL